MLGRILQWEENYSSLLRDHLVILIEGSISHYSDNLLSHYTLRNTFLICFSYFEYVQNPKNGGQLKLGGLAPSNLELALVKQYPFDSAVQRMTVVAKKKGTPAYSVFIKGAPEKVASLCRPNTSEAESFFISCAALTQVRPKAFLFRVPP